MKHELRDRLNRAVDTLPHPDARQIWETPVTALATMDHDTQQPLPARRPRWARAALSFACLALLIFGLSWYFNSRAVALVVELDINPSFKIQLNSRYHVVSVTGTNPEAEALLQGRNYRGWAAEDTVETLMLLLDEDQHLLANTQNTVLLSVRGKNRDQADLLGLRLSQKIQATVDRAQTPTTVLRQTITDTNESEETPGISSGLHRLIAALSRQTGKSIAVLSALSLEELEELADDTYLEDAIELEIDRSAWRQSTSSQAPDQNPSDDEDDDSDDDDEYEDDDDFDD